MTPPKKRRPAKRYPPIPDSLRLPGGDVPVEVCTKEKMQAWADPGEVLFGYFHEAERRISLLGTMTREAQWRVLFHEWMHAVLQDSGISNGLNNELEEAICDAASSALMRTQFSA